MNDRCRWGVLGTANIARKNWKAIWNAENATLVAIGSRTAERARQFVSECQSRVPFDTPPAACDSYEAVLNRDDLDAIYLPLPTGMRLEWVRRAAEAGMHVLCEKPCGASSEEVTEMIETCRKHQVQFMDGVMFMHSRRLTHLEALLGDDRSVGDIKRVATHHCFRAPQAFLDKDIRLNHALEPYGCLGDLGWYNIRIILWALRWAMPHHVTGRVLSEMHRADSSAPVPVEFSGELFFADQVSAAFYCSFLTENQQWVNVGGTRGYLRVADFVLPFHGSELGYSIYNASYDMRGCDFLMQGRVRDEWVSECSESQADSQETNLFRNFSQLVVSGSRDEFWPRIALSTQQVMDACLESARQDGARISLPTR